MIAQSQDGGTYQDFYNRRNKRRDELNNSQDKTLEMLSDEGDSVAA